MFLNFPERHGINPSTLESYSQQSFPDDEDLKKQEAKILIGQENLPNTSQKVSRVSQYIGINQRSMCLNVMTICTISLPVFWLNYCFNSDRQEQSLICFDANYKYLIGVGAFFLGAVGMQWARMMNDCKLLKQQLEV
jgi:hypothetical protein